MKLTDLFRVIKGRGAYREDVGTGFTPLISATSKNNGVLDYVDLSPIFCVPAITVERVSGQAFVQLAEFATVPADVSVLVPKNVEMPLEVFFMVAAIINLEKWRYSYGRKLTSGRLKKMEAPITVDQNGKVDIGLVDV